MKTNSLTKNITYKVDKPNVEVLLETSFSKEIRITMQAGQVMKEHQTPYPIVVEIFEGKIDFGVQGNISQLEKGDILTLEGAVPHDLKALENSIVRLTLSKYDKVERVQEVAKQ
ncbi:cupin [Capnocytophaga catalasegens]|uniref:Cupin n=1 Tax=Capnocytophaga catalasegens TaxID=1004260 RepID=A0AAV5AX26_9FLAO|nr:cupin [Capnocytophaga catalasegens]GIZ15691.1 cupin [Capnocytophaga catalasegens]GJM50078.1 cupin [Capnocytophaga catalasegens]GJM53097.1 cupin [Capnocytophaga catalasegens]